MPTQARTLMEFRTDEHDVSDMPVPTDLALPLTSSSASDWTDAKAAKWQRRVMAVGGIAPSVWQDVFKEKTLISKSAPNAWLSKTRLKEMRNLAPGSLDPSSLRIQAGDRELILGVDVLLDEMWGGLGLPAGSSLSSQDEVELSYRLSTRRVDALVRNSHGLECIRPGVPHLTNPDLPDLLDGDALLAHVFVDYHSDGRHFDVLPLIGHGTTPLTATTGPERIPATVNKLKSAQPVKIVCWGDSVTEGGGLAPGERYPDQLALRLGRIFPDAAVEVVAVGGSGTRHWLMDPSPDQRHVRQDETRFQRVLDARPDLVIVEFVNDDYLSKAETLKRYRSLIIAPLRAVGAEVLLLAPHHNWDRRYWKGSFRDKDNREYVDALREMGLNDEDVGLADVAGRWENLWREGTPYPVYLSNGFNHPDSRGHKLFTEELLRALGLSDENLKHNPVPGKFTADNERARIPVQNK